jgi:hypothetical protein
MRRKEFRETVFERDDYTCNVPWCDRDAVDAHHIIERELWPSGGYIPDNGASVCNDHHRMAERNEIPPQAFWRWAGIEEPPIPFPNGLDEHPEKASIHVEDTTELIAIDKWGEQFETPPHGQIREYPKYPSSRHLLPLYWQSERGTAQERTGRDDTGLDSVESFLDIPLVATIKMDGSNAMLVADETEPVRARNGRDANHESFDHLKQEYWNRNVYENLPEHLQVFGENMYACHSIHYGCDGCHDERNQRPPVSDVFLVFGVYDTRYDLWLSWPETERVADEIGFPTAPVIKRSQTDLPAFEDERRFVESMKELAESVVDDGHEGIIVRSKYPFHYGQFETKLGKYVRPNHVQTDEHWSHQDTTRNEVQR